MEAGGRKFFLTGEENGVGVLEDESVDGRETKLENGGTSIGEEGV